jgi:hypothetical protein
MSDRERIAELELENKRLREYAYAVGKVLADGQDPDYLPANSGEAAKYLINAMLDDDLTDFVVSAVSVFEEDDDGRALATYDLYVQRAGAQTYQENLDACIARNTELEAMIHELRGTLQ